MVDVVAVPFHSRAAIVAKIVFLKFTGVALVDGTQVLSFYYKYLAAAEPLTDVVYGAEVSAS